MKFAVDTHHLLLEHAGTKRVTLNILEQLRTQPGIALVEFQPTYALSIGSGLLAKIYGHLIRFVWVQIHLPILCYSKRVDFLLSPEYYTPLYTTCKRGVIAHDAHIRAQKEFINPIWFYLYYVPFIETAIRAADLIFTVSNFAKEQVIDLMRLDPAKVHVTYNGVDQSFLVNGNYPSAQVLKAGLVPNKYILFVGTFEARKNIERLIEAFALVKKRSGSKSSGIKLAIVGKASTGMYSNRGAQINTLIDSLDMRTEIVLCGYVSDQDLPAYYANANMVVFPSLYEGFGLPIIEGFASGIPVLTSTIASMPEIAGNAAILADPYDTNDIANKMELVMFDISLREQLIAAGYERIKCFTWEHFVRQIVSCIKPLFRK